MTTVELNGIITAIVTPFTADGSAVDEQALRRLVAFQADAGVGGIIPGGSTGEFFAMTAAERRLVTEVAVDAAAGVIPVIPHTGALTTAEALALTVHAQDAGADAVMVIPPFYEPVTWNELVTHYRTISDAIDIPIMYYHMPAATHLDLSIEHLEELASIENIRWVKDSSGNAVNFGELRYQIGDRIGLINGEDKLTFAAFAEGGEASVWGSATFFPALAVELSRALQAGNLAEARAVWQRIWPIMLSIGDVAYQSAVKAGLELVGLPVGQPRLPLVPAPREYYDKLAGILRASGVEPA